MGGGQGLSQGMGMEADMWRHDYKYLENSGPVLQTEMSAQRSFLRLS